MKYFKLSFVLLLSLFFVAGCGSSFHCMGSPTGCSRAPNPYFVTTKPLMVKKINVPTGTKLVYEEHLFKEGLQSHIMSESKLTHIILPDGQTIDWGGVPVGKISKYFNSEMRGFSVYPHFSQLKEHQKTKFARLWQSCGSDLGVSVVNIDDWSFNVKNISDVDSCSVLYQRYFKNDIVQQKFLDALYQALKNEDSK